MVTVVEVLQQGLAHHRAGRSDEARELYRRVLAFDRRQPDALHLLGNLELESGRPGPAILLLTRAVESKPEWGAYRASLARAFRQGGDAPRALAQFRWALACDPRDASAWHELAELSGDKASPRRQSALKRVHRLLAIRSDLGPEDVPTLRSLAQEQLSAGNFDDAVVSLRRLSRLTPAANDVRINLGIALHHSGLGAAGARELRAVLALEPGRTVAWLNLGLICRGMDRLAWALTAFARGVDADPASADASEALAWTRHLTGDAVGAATAYRKLIELRPNRPEHLADLILTTNCLTEASAHDILALQRSYGARFAPVATEVATKFANEIDETRRLRIGYVAVEGFRQHTAAVTILPLVESHDRRSVEIYCYSDVPAAREDATTARFKARAEGWRNVQGESDEKLADRIRDDRIDILADVYGYPPGSRLLALARRPAPVQFNLLPMGSFGIEAVNWMLGDARLTPPGSESWFSERIVRVPLAFCYTPLIRLPEIRFDPERRGSPIVFGCFNQPAKISDLALSTWAEILLGIARSRLVLKSMAFVDPEICVAYRRRLGRLGVPIERVDLRPWQANRGEHLAAYNDIDIALDPFPYGGVISTCEAMSMGVPVITLAGDRLLGRYGAALLASLGLESLIAESPADYVRLALTLAAAERRLREFKTGLRSRLFASRIADGAAYARAVESAYRHAWIDWCRNPC
jgi:predicted O-linked N-acetylglucosamine transferase (SPINDLY family)